MSNKKTLLNEMQVRRWGKLAAIGSPLTENWLDALIEEEEEEGEEEMAMGMDMPMGDEEAPAEEAPAEEAPAGGLEDKVEDIVAAVVDAIADVTNVDISMEADAEDAEDSEDADDDDAEDAEDPAMRDEEDEPGMRDMKPMEGLDLDVIDDEELTEAILKRVVERLSKRSK
jgi:hypothetical protein